VPAAAVLGWTRAAPDRWPMETGCFWGGREVSYGRVLLGLGAEAWSLAGLARRGRHIGVMPALLGARRVLEVCWLMVCRDSWDPPYMFLLMAFTYKAADAAETC